MADLREKRGKPGADGSPAAAGVTSELIDELNRVHGSLAHFAVSLCALPEIVCPWKRAFTQQVGAVCVCVCVCVCVSSFRLLGGAISLAPFIVLGSLSLLFLSCVVSSYNMLVSPHLFFSFRCFSSAGGGRAMRRGHQSVGTVASCGDRSCPERGGSHSGCGSSATCISSFPCGSFLSLLTSLSLLVLSSVESFVLRNCSCSFLSLRVVFLLLWAHLLFRGTMYLSTSNTRHVGINSENTPVGSENPSRMRRGGTIHNPLISIQSSSPY
jgi:hypothetical protein